MGVLPDPAVVESLDLPLTTTEGDTSGGAGAVLTTMAALTSHMEQPATPKAPESGKEPAA